MYKSVGVLASVLFYVLTASGAPADRALEIDIPAGSLVKALEKLGDQSGIQVIYETRTAQGVTVQALSGKFTLQAALSQLLANTGLKVESINDKMVVLKRADASTSNDTPAGQMRVALVESTKDGESSRKEDKESGDAKQVTVRDKKLKPDFSVNADIPRTIDDAQPYYIFDSKTIDLSGAVNVEDFLKQRLTMNGTARNNSQKGGDNLQGNTSSINLRGLGIDKTLVLVDGRRMAGVTFANGSNLASQQPDLNGIPLNFVERIEVLPSSASGIYGGSAIGGVVNVILKRDYSGGEARATYDNTWSTDSPRRDLSLAYGFTVEDGRSRILVSGQISDAKPLLLRDRRAQFERNLATIRSNDVDFITSLNVPFLGSLPNIYSYSFTFPYTIINGFFVPNNLVLKNGTALNTYKTYIPAGTAPGVPANVLNAALIANAGSQNLDLPASTQWPQGLLRPFGASPQTKAFQATVSRQMSARLDMFLDFRYTDNHSNSVANSVFSTTGAFVPGSSPANPFVSTVLVRIPSDADRPITTDSEVRSITAGMAAKLPFNWTAQLDYTWSESGFAFHRDVYDVSGLDADLANGALNPFVDTLLHPLSLDRYVFPFDYAGSSNLRSLALRGSGPLFSLPWGVPRLTVGLEHQVARTPESSYESRYPITTSFSSHRTYLARKQNSDSAYGETVLPLIRQDWLPLVYSLDLQISGRVERHEVDTGSPSYLRNLTTGTVTYEAPRISPTQPYFSRADYSSSNYTTALKYQFSPELMLRISRATAFLPPTPLQLVRDPLPNPNPTTVNDPVTGGSYGVQTTSGGNPGLAPQRSRSFNLGVIWQPEWQPLRGLRVNAEYYRIEQFDAIGSLSAQSIVANENLFADRVVRNAAGLITSVDTSMINLFRRETEGWDLSLDYRVKTAAGTFGVNAVGSRIDCLEEQYSLTLPAYDAVGFPSEGGAARYKANTVLSWERENWSASWTVRYFSSYKQIGAAGGPTSLQSYNGAAYNYYIVPQGSDVIPSHTYHDVVMNYRLSRSGSALLDGLEIQLGVENLFDRGPNMDVYYDYDYYFSPYGDSRMRSYWVSVRRKF